MTRGVLTISSRNYGSWSLRGSLLCSMAGLDIEERTLPPDDASARAELLRLWERLDLEGRRLVMANALAVAEVRGRVAVAPQA